MKNEEFEEILKQRNIKKYVWSPLSEIKTLILKNNSYVYPDFEHCRYLITDKEILIRHGSSIPYGLPLGDTLRFSCTMDDIAFPPGMAVERNIYSSRFRLPAEGDIVECYKPSGELISMSYVTNVINARNEFSMSLASPVRVLRGEHFRLAFYDPKEKTNDSIHCWINGNFGIYLNFKEIPGKKKSKLYGLYDQKIKIKKIQVIE